MARGACTGGSYPRAVVLSSSALLSVVGNFEGSLESVAVIAARPRVTGAVTCDALAAVVLALCLALVDSGGLRSNDVGTAVCQAMNDGHMRSTSSWNLSCRS